LLKWLVYLVLGLVLGATFVAYFAGPDGVAAALAAPGAHPAAMAALGGVAALTMLDFAFLREQVCTTACPYGRLQTVLYDADTLIVGYDERRGEPRARLLPGDGGRAPDAGDCIDCHGCVVTCPTGIDIRRGLQMECVGCAQCIDACDAVMDRVRRPRGLIRYTSTAALEGRAWHPVRPRIVLYSAILLGVYAAFWTLLATRATATVDLTRGSTETFRGLPDGRVANRLRLRVTNQLHEPQAFHVVAVAPAGAELVADADPLIVAADAVESVALALKSPAAAYRGGRATARLRVTSDAGFAAEREAPLLGPVGD
jgi:cytochrome c oxidase accessory protein FixG